MEDSEVIRLEVDADPAVQGTAKANAAMDGYSKKADSAARGASKSFGDHGDVVVRTSERSRGSIERLTSAWEKQAALYGKSGVDRIIAQRDQLIARLGNEEKAIEKVRAAAKRMIEEEQRMGGGAGFNKTFAIKGVKDVFEGRGAYAIAELVNELMSLKGAALWITGAVTAVAGIGFAAYEANKKMQELAEAPEKLHVKFGRLNDQEKLTNAELRVTNDRLENTIAKLEHRPENRMKLAIDEAAVAAGKLAEKLDKSLQSFQKLMSENAPSVIDRNLFNVAGVKDLQEMIGGKSGVGGMIAEVYKSSQSGQDPTKILSAQRSKLQALLEQSKSEQASYLAKSGVGQRFLPADMRLANNKAFTGTAKDQSQRLEFLQAYLEKVNSQIESYGLEKKNASLTAKKEGLEGTAAISDRLAELEKRSREAYGVAYFGEQTPYGKYLGRLDKIKEERQDFLRLNNDGKPATIARADQAFNTQRIAAWMEYVDESAKSLKHLNDALDETALDTRKRTESYFKKQSELDFENERSAGIVDQHGRLAGALELPEAPVPVGYVSPQQQLRDVHRQEQLAVTRTTTAAYLSGTRPERQTDALYKLRQDYADKALQAELRIAETKATEHEKEEARIEARSHKEERLFEAQMEREDRLIQLTKSRFDEIKHSVSGLYETLFTRPRQFGGQLFGTLRDAALKPVINNLSTATTRFLFPMIHGQSLDPVKISTDQNSVVTAQNTQAVLGLTSAMSAAGGFVAPGAGNGIFTSAAMGGGDFGNGTYVAPFGFPGAASAAPSSPLSALAGIVGAPAGAPANTSVTVSDTMESVRPVSSPVLGSLSGILGGPGGTSGFAGPVGGSGGGLRGILGGLFGRGGRGPAGAAGLNLTGLLDGFFNRGNIYMAPHVGINAAGIGGIGGTLAGIASSPAAMAAGGMLAMAGLTGSRRGTFGGTIMGSLGGALAGFALGSKIGALGGPLGAVIGGGAGLLAGIGMMLAGVESPEKHAHKLIQQIYGVNIPEKSGVISQIVQMSQQYGGSISMTVRTPQARQLIELYAMSVGQPNKLFQESVHSAGLVQAGGKLNQALSYFNGSGYSYQSSLPTLGPSAGTIPTSNPYSGGGFNIQLDGPATTALLSGQVAKVATPQFVAQQNQASLQSSGSRYQTAAAVLAPNQVFA
jgi:hypothetical protein